MSDPGDEAIRRAGPEDAGTILRLVSQLGYPVESEQGQAACEAVLRDPHMVILLVEAEERALGMVSLNIRPQIHHAGPVATIDELVVDEICRGQGVGTALLREAITLCRAQSCQVMDVASAHHRLRARDFYLKRGFEDYGTKFVLELGEER